MSKDIKAERRITRAVGFIFTLLALILVLAFLFLFSDSFNAPFYLPTIQQALDEQCGIGVASADIRGFTRDPKLSWWGDGVMCHLDSIDKNWICLCGE